ncbi:hypothetical protein [Pseudomonas sp. TTU2014-080ASC]|uniref:hypothetical protein n=1 Tax=Pseudomonas sp. TTU2014-080ASC TaxID=1729724 RepID=UPI0007186A4D|nr:hypothetical protein [Pseudomonas sp. TTU2014-080ASC]KRW58510.1 hypothetical protein AO726_16850 [Pseudomonas sp. TTU2014-080ASC]
MKKLAVTIGSLFGVFASIVGVVAIFFPDALNLQKNKIDSFEVEINTRADADALYKFLEEHPGKLVQLSVNVCSTREHSNAQPRLERLNYGLRVYHDDCDPSGEFMCTSDTYYFADYEDEKAHVWGWDKFGDCANGEDSGVNGVGGYFMVPEGAGFGQGNLEWMLDPVDAKEIALKNY